MNEENKVELDTDDVQEENVSVQEQPKEEKPEQVEIQKIQKLSRYLLKKP